MAGKVDGFAEAKYGQVYVEWSLINVETPITTPIAGNMEGKHSFWSPGFGRKNPGCVFPG